MTGATGGSHGVYTGDPRPAPKGGGGLAVGALVCGILACLLFWTIVGGIVLGLAGLVLGVMASRRAKRGVGRGGTMGIVGAVLGALGLIGGAVVLAVSIWVWNSDDFDNFEDCMRHADTASEEQQCAEDFGEDLTN